MQSTVNCLRISTQAEFCKLNYSPKEVGGLTNGCNAWLMHGYSRVAYEPLAHQGLDAGSPPVR